MKYRRTSSSLSQLIRVVNTPEMKSGSFEVKHCTEEGFYFNLNVAEDLFKFIQNYGQFPNLRRSILVHTASRCLEILSKEYAPKGEEEEGSESWEGYRNLVALTAELDKKSLPHWSEDDFCPEKVATSLYPIELPNNNDLENRIMQYQEFDDGTYTYLRKNLLKEKGSALQKDFVAALQSKKSFLKYIESKIKIKKSSRNPLFE